MYTFYIYYIYYYFISLYNKYIFVMKNACRNVL